MAEIFDIKKALKDMETYKTQKNELTDYILEDFSRRHEKVIIEVKDKKVEMTKGRLLLNMIIKRILVGKNIVLTEEDIFSDESLTEKSLYNQLNRLIQRTDEELDSSERKKVVMDIISEISNISGFLNVKAGNTISYLDLVKLYADDPEFREIVSRELKDHKRFTEMEKEFDKAGDDILEYFSNKPEAELYPFIKSQTGVNKQQFTQALSMIGLKPDIEGNIIPKFMTDNYFIGLNNTDNMESYYINSIGARKALIINSRMVRRSGYLTRKISLAMLDNYHDHSTYDCGTEHTLKVTIPDKQTLPQYYGRHYYDLDEDNNNVGELKTISENSTDLIGKKIGLRSPVTCSLKHTCATCYGRSLSETNKDLNTGLIATLLLTEPLTQKLLSAKHLLTTNAEEVNWPETKEGKFLDYFSINMNSLYADPNYIIEFNLLRGEDLDEEEEDLYTERVNVYENNAGKPGKQVAGFVLPTRLYYEPSFELEFLEVDKNEMNEVVGERIVLSQDNLDDSPMFTFQAVNNELINSLEDIIKLIESSDHLGVTEYDEMVEVFNEKVLINDLNVASVHLEMIVRELIRNTDDKERLNLEKYRYISEKGIELMDEIIDKKKQGEEILFNDYKKRAEKEEVSHEIEFLSDLNYEESVEYREQFRSYSIFRISNAILDGPISKSFAFERLEQQLAQPETYNKTYSSLMDYLYI